MAGMTRLEQTEFYVGIQALYLDLEFTPDANTTVPGAGADAKD